MGSKDGSSDKLTGELKDSLEALADKYRLKSRSEQPISIGDIYFEGNKVYFGINHDEFGGFYNNMSCSLKTSHGKVLVYLLNNIGKELTAQEIFEGSEAKSLLAAKNSLDHLYPEINRWTKYFEFKKIKGRPSKYILNIK